MARDRLGWEMSGHELRVKHHLAEGRTTHRDCNAGRRCRQRALGKPAPQSRALGCARGAPRRVAGGTLNLIANLIAPPVTDRLAGSVITSRGVARAVTDDATRYLRKLSWSRMAGCIHEEYKKAISLVYFVQGLPPAVDRKARRAFFLIT